MKTNIFIALVALIFVVGTASAVIPITSNVTETSIMWSWGPGLTLTNMSVDGIYVCGFDATGQSFVLSDLGPNEAHTITILTAGDFGSNTATTATNPLKDNSTDFTGLLNTWWYLLLIVVLCLVGMVKKLGLFLAVASAVSLYALYNYITNNTITGSQTLSVTELPFLIYIAFFIIPIFLAYAKGGYTK